MDLLKQKSILIKGESRWTLTTVVQGQFQADPILWVWSAFTVSCELFFLLFTYLTEELRSFYQRLGGIALKQFDFIFQGKKKTTTKQQPIFSDCSGNLLHIAFVEELQFSVFSSYITEKRLQAALLTMHQAFCFSLQTEIHPISCQGFWAALSNR